MYSPRRISALPKNSDGIKRYSISADGVAVEAIAFEQRLAHLKTQKPLGEAAFALFHRGESLRYLVLCYWGNDNELFTSVSVQEATGWVEDAKRYSFCLYDMEVMWAERNFYIQTMDVQEPNLMAYQARLFEQDCADRGVSA